MGLYRRLAESGLTWGRAATASLGLALLSGCWTAFSLGWRFGWSDPGQIAVLGLIYAVGAGVGFALALLGSSLGFPRAPRRWRIAGTALLGLVAALGAIFVLLVLEHRSYYSQWHAPAFTYVWFVQQAFTMLSAGAQFAVMGVRYPGIGALALIVAASWWAHRPAH